MGKKKSKPKSHPIHIYKLYEVNGDKLVRKTQFCPKCGVGVYLAKHNNRFTCGKCGYTEFIK